MAWHLYVIPSIGTGAKDDVFRPKYLEVMRVNHSCMPYRRGVAFIVAADVTDLEDLQLSAHLDVKRVPDGREPTAVEISDALARQILVGLRLGPSQR